MRNKVTALLTVCLLLLAAAACSTGGDPSPAPEGASSPKQSAADGNSSGGGEKDDPVSVGGSEAYTAYTKMIKGMSASSADSAQYDMDFTMSISMEFEGAIVPPEMSKTKMFSRGSTKAIIDGGDIQYYHLMSVSGAGSMSIVELLYDGQNAYCAVNGSKVDISGDEVMEQINSSSDIMPDFEENAIKSVEMKSIGNDAEYSIVIDGQELSDFIKEYAGDELAALEGGTLTFSDVTMRFLVDGDAKPKEMDMIMAMSVSMDALGLSMNLTMEYNVVFNQFGDGVEIDFSPMGKN